MADIFGLQWTVFCGLVKDFIDKVKNIKVPDSSKFEIVMDINKVVVSQCEGLLQIMA